MSPRGFRSTRLFALASVVALAAACSGGSGLSRREGRIEVLLSNTPVQELATFTATIEDVRLNDDVGGTTGNLLGAPVNLELMGLGDRSTLLASSLSKRGTYGSAQITFQEGSLRAISKDGTEIPVVAIENIVNVSLSENAVVARQGFTTVRLNLDLRSSLNDVLSPATLGFAPTATGTGSAAPFELPVDDFRGLVLSSDASNSIITVQSFLDDDLTTPVRSMQVQVDPTAYLEDEADVAFADQASFFAALVQDASLLELHGNQNEKGTFLAKRIEIEDHTGGLDSDDQVKIEGYVLNVDALGSMELVIQEIEQGSTAASSVLGILGDPRNIDVTFDAMMPVFQNLSATASPTALEVGQRVKVKFDDFSASPFRARSVEIVGGAAFDTEITDVQGFMTEVHLTPTDFAVQSGLVDNTETAVQVDIASARLVLDVENQPRLSGVELLAGQGAIIRGSLAGPSNSPVIDATEVRIVPGRFQGYLSSSNPAGSSFEARIAGLPETFGHTAPICNVTIRPECVFRGAAADEVEFFSLYSALAVGDHLEVNVQGIASGQQNEVAAFVIEVVSH